MEIARSQISAANYVATTSHALILDAQANIVRSEKPEDQSGRDIGENDDASAATNDCSS